MRESVVKWGPAMQHPSRVCPCCGTVARGGKKPCKRTNQGKKPVPTATDLVFNTSEPTALGFGAQQGELRHSASDMRALSLCTALGHADGTQAWPWRCAVRPMALCPGGLQDRRQSTAAGSSSRGGGRPKRRLSLQLKVAAAGGGAAAEGPSLPNSTGRSIVVAVDSSEARSRRPASFLHYPTS